MKKESVWNRYTDAQAQTCEAVCRTYMEFVSACKTERRCVAWMREALKAAGFVSLQACREQKRVLQAGDRVYATWMDKTLMMIQIGSAPMETGMQIIGAHLDSPRLDIKQNPFYTAGDLVCMDTHYYGGIKKYQWVAMPLTLQGVVVKQDGSRVDLSIGDGEDEPVFFVSDLLIHLANEQMKKKGTEVVNGEALDLLVGNRPMQFKRADAGKEDDPFTGAILHLLQVQYGIEEEDFFSAELTAVPAGKAREAGFDRSMILAYGHDDKVCAWAGWQALIGMERPTRTCCCIFADKEEIGNFGATGMESHFFENTLAEILALQGQTDNLTLRRCLANSRMLSADVNGAFDPLYSDCFDEKNASYLGRGIVLNKFSGSAGKSGGSEANPEFIARLRRIFAEADVAVQLAELGKVDLGGGGTIAYVLARYGMEIVDCGIGVLNMHAPWEAASKADIYELLRGFTAFFADA